MRLTLLTIATILLIACIYTLYNMNPPEIVKRFDEETQEWVNVDGGDTCIFNLDSIEEYDRMVMDSLDKESMDWTGTTQGDSLK